MKPFKVLQPLRRFFGQTKTAATLSQDDPFSHPDIRAMDLRQLADLPFPDRLRPKSAPERPLTSEKTLAKCA